MLVIGQNLLLFFSLLLFVVSLSLLDHALTLLAAGGLFLSPTTLRFLRFFRIVRLLKLIKHSLVAEDALARLLENANCVKHVE
jgi:hypothetical protein